MAVKMQFNSILVITDELDIVKRPSIFQ
jgi:hypothetical protein